MSFVHYNLQYFILATGIDINNDYHLIPFQYTALGYNNILYFSALGTLFITSLPS